MAVYTHVSESRLDAFLAAYDLGARRALTGIAAGSENTNYRLATDSGRYILTLYDGRIAPEGLPFCLDLMGFLAAADLPVPRPVPRRDGTVLGRLEGQPAAILTFLDGRAADAPGPDQCQAMGAMLAELHIAGAGFPETRPNAFGLAGWHRIFARCRDGADSIAPGLAAEIAATLAELDQAWPADLPEGAIHGDLFPDNLFFAARHGAGRSRVSGVIDFYFACTDSLAYDLAIALNAWAFPEPERLDPARAGALLAGYQSRRPLSAGERAALPVLARGAAMRYLLTRLETQLFPRPGAPLEGLDPLAFRARLRAHQQMASPAAYGLAAGAAWSDTPRAEGSREESR